MTLSLCDATENAAYYFHMHIQDVDVKVKIVAIGQPSEAVSVFCTHAGTRQAWGAAAEQTAQNLLEMVRQAFPSTDYKAIPLMSQHYAGLKIHRARGAYTYFDGHERIEPTDQSMEILVQVRQLLEDAARHPHMLNQQQMKRSRHSFHNRVADVTLRNEITRILASSSQMEAKVNSLARLLERQG